MIAITRWFSYLLAGLAGGWLFWAMAPSPCPVEQGVAQSTAHMVNVHPHRNAATPDFVAAAAAAMPVVVHIKASESTQRARQRIQQERMRNPWGFFGDDFFFGFPNQGSGSQIKEGSGSGVIFSPDGYVVTNNHVVDFADQIEVTLNDSRKFQAQLVGHDPKTDLAVLKIDAQGLPTLRMADSDQSRVGEWVLAVGNPFNLTSTVTAGIISAKGRKIDIIKARDAIEAFIQTDAAVNPGNSGGALVDVQGRLLGINTAIATRTGYYSGYSFAIPVNMMRRIVEDIITLGYSQRAKMGISVVELDAALATELGLPMTQGLVVEYLEEGGASELAGLRPFDVITEINGKPVERFPQLQEQAGQTRPGDVMRLLVYREGKYLRMQVTLR
jgi:serine protease Do